MSSEREPPFILQTKPREEKKSSYPAEFKHETHETGADSGFWPGGGDFRKKNIIEM